MNSPLAADSLAAVDSAATLSVPTAKELGLRALVAAPEKVVKGDTFELQVNVAWQAPAGQSVLLIVPTTSANTKGVSQLGVREEHSREVQNGREVSTSRFIYTLSADDTGSVTIPSLGFQIPTPSGPIEFSSATTSLRIDGSSHVALFAGIGAFLAFLIVGGVLATRRRKKLSATLEKEKNREQVELAKEFLLLKKRVANADSRGWLLELEKICKCWADKRFGCDNLEALAKEGKLDGWDALLDEFAHARYGGGERDAFMNKETWKLASKLLKIQEDE